MPRTYSESEREFIRKKLTEEAVYCLERYGVRKTTVDELVKRAGIPKGTFYLFYRSKELLFFDAFCQYHDAIQERFLRRLGEAGGGPAPEKLTALILELYKEVEGSFLYRLMTSGELELLMHRLPPEAHAAHRHSDDLNVEMLVSLVPGMQEADVKAFSGALRGVFLSMMYKKEIGDEVFDDALRIMIRGVVTQMFGSAER
jgi:AcrR family transcriptional regulator